ncbi:hypothetical protein AAMO2058_001198000 [Amorphochlora amoebiformis]
MAHYQSLDDRRPASWSLRLSMAANILLLALIGYLVVTDQSPENISLGIVRSSPSMATSRFSPATASLARDVRVNAKSKKGDRLMVTLECTEAREQGKMPSRYTTTKNRKNTPERLEMKKYNKFLRRHTVHREIKKSK